MLPQRAVSNTQGSTWTVILFFQLTGVQDPPLCLEAELSMLSMQGATWLRLLESLSGHTDLHHISCLNMDPKDLPRISQGSSLDPFHDWVLGTVEQVEQNGAWSPKQERRSGTPGQYRWSWNSRTGWPATHNKRPNQLQVSGRCKGWQKHAWNQLFCWFPGVCSKGSRWIKKSQVKQLTHLFFIYYRYFTQLCVKPPAPHNHKYWSRRAIFLPPT